MRLGLIEEVPEGPEIDSERVAETVRTANGIFRVWDNVGRTPRARPPDEEWPYTDSAVAAKAEWDPDEDDGLLQCVPPGMPEAMLNSFPIEFVDGGDTIILRIEEWNLGRTIYMPGAARPAGLASPALGYSEGRWEDGVLVVTTTDIGYPYMDDVGTPLGEAAEIIERFEMSEDGTRMDLRWTIIDPGTFTEPVELQVLHYEWRPDLQIRLYDCEPAQFER